MGLRIRKSVKFGPFRLNFSKSGVGYSFGGKGFRVTKRADGGVQSTASIPGTGISYTQTHSSNGSGKRAASAAPASGGKAAKKSGGKKPWIIGILAVLLLAGAASSCGGDGQEDSQGDPPQVEETAIPQDAAQAAPEGAGGPEGQDPAQAPADAPESVQDAPEGQDTAPTQETPASGPAAPPETASEPDPEPSTNERTVYITETGSKYHYDGNCGNGTYYPTTLDKAQSMGLTPCAKCAGG